MSNDELSLRDRAVLLTLMAEVRPVPNGELRRRGLALGPADRDRLHRYVAATDTGRNRYEFELADRGWQRCEQELAAAPPEGRLGAAGQALYAVLAGLRRHLEQTDTRLSDVFRPDFDAMVLAAYRGLRREPGDYVLLTRVREALADVLREDVDAALVRLSQRPRVRLVPESNQKALTAGDRAAAVRLGGQDRHLLAVDEE